MSISTRTRKASATTTWLSPPTGKPQTAFFNRGLGAQSYHPNSDAVLPLVRRNIKLIKDGFAPDAYFIDVWSSEPPYDYYASDGRFFDRLHTRDVWREGFAFIRDYLGGAPQISEAGADQYIGWLDAGAGAHMRAEGGPERSNVWHIETSDTERVPWFDNAYHDVFVLQGAGYPGRYNSGQDNRSHGMYSDDYLTTEAMTGHPSMVWDAFSRDTVRKYWLLHDLMRGLALRRMQDFAFAGTNLHRQEIRWDKGGEVWVNRGGGRLERCAARTSPIRFLCARSGKGGRAGGRHRATGRPHRGVVEGAGECGTSMRVRWCPRRPPAGEALAGSGPDPRLPRMNPEGRVVTFGALSTNGGFRLIHSGGGLELMPLPSSPSFTASLRWRDLPWKLAASQEKSKLWIKTAAYSGACLST